MPENWISVKEAAKIRKCTAANIRYLITVGKIEGKKDGGRWLINKTSIGNEKDFSQTADVFAVLKANLKRRISRYCHCRSRRSDLTLSSYNSRGKIR